MIYGYKQLKTADDWRDVVGGKNWVPNHSAYELAHKWESGTLPPRVQQVLNSSTSPLLSRLVVDYMLVEKPVFLDTYKAPSMTDIMIYCNMQAGEPVVIAVEGKARETFDLNVADWVRGGTCDSKPTRLNRLTFLSNALGVPVDSNSELRYQLIHRSASALLESGLHGSASCVLLIHSFSDASKSNWEDYKAFLEHIGIPHAAKNILLGPVKLGSHQDINFFSAWISDDPV